MHVSLCLRDYETNLLQRTLSNRDAANSSWKPYVDLHSKLEEYSKAPNRRQIIIFTNEADGLFTNAPPFDKFFEPFSMLNIFLYCFYGGVATRRTVWKTFDKPSRRWENKRRLSPQPMSW